MLNQTSYVHDVFTLGRRVLEREGKRGRLNEKEVHHIEAESFPTAIEEAEEWLASEVNERKALIVEEELQKKCYQYLRDGKIGHDVNSKRFTSTTRAQRCYINLM